MFKTLGVSVQSQKSEKSARRPNACEALSLPRKTPLSQLQSLAIHCEGEYGMLEVAPSVQRTVRDHHAQGKFVEGMAPVFSRSAWHCAWHLIQNDLVHGWGMDMKLGYCAQANEEWYLERKDDPILYPTQEKSERELISYSFRFKPGLLAFIEGDRSKNVGVVDSEYVVHQGIQTLGGVSARKASTPEESTKIRRQSTSELQIFKKRWEQAVKEDKNWVDPFRRKRRLDRRRNQRLHI
ncbi:hypothetical protein U1Q18_009122 [Sarracenia purpurea var. burkii]